MRTLCGLAILVALLIGIFFGIWIDNRRPRPNKIWFEVQSGGKVNLIPKVGDVLYWTADPSWNGTKPETHLTINFARNQNPCSSMAQSLGTTEFICTIGPRLQEVPNYLYGCSSDDPNFSCYDPGMGPVSTTGPGGNRFDDRYSRVIKLDFTYLLAKSEFAESPDSSSPTSPVAPLATPLGAPKPAMAKTGTPRTPYVYCDSGQVHVDPTPTQPGSIADDPLNVAAGDTITWNHSVPFTITGLTTLCTEQNDITQDKPTCHVTGPANPYTYKVTVTGSPSACPANPNNDKETIQVQ